MYQAQKLWLNETTNQEKFEGSNGIIESVIVKMRYVPLKIHYTYPFLTMTGPILVINNEILVSLNPGMLEKEALSFSWSDASALL